MNNKRRLFGKKEQSTSLQTPCQPEPQQSSIYHNIINLPLIKFIECIVDNNLYALVISGHPTPQELNKAWANILTEYSDTIGNAEYKLYVSTFKELSILQLTYQSIQILVGLLQNVYVKELCDELNKLLRTNCKFNYLDEKSYQEELLKCERRSKGVKIQLDLKAMQFEAIQKKNTDKKADRAYFDSVLITLSDHAKYEINETITVSKFCERLKRYNQYCDAVKSKK